MRRRPAPAGRRRPPGAVVVLAVLAVIGVAQNCSGGGNGGEQAGGGDVPANCTAVDAAVSPEKVELLTRLATDFNRSDEARAGGRCTFVRVQSKSSGQAARVLADGWRDESVDGPRPVIWSPAATSWGAVLNHRLTERGQGPMAPADARPFMLTPLVIAMPRPMAQALGHPETPIGYADLIALSQDPAGWASKGHPEWGRFKFGKTNPNFSTSALSATVAQYYAATGKDRDLSIENLNDPEVEAFSRAVESSVVHYGDITATFLENWYRNDQRGTALTYVSAVAVEEKSVIDYNRGNPDGITEEGERPRPPKVPLVAVYPKEGTLFSDNPFYVLDAPWVSGPEREGARAFESFAQRPENQRRVLDFGFRPGNPDVAVGPPIVAANGVDPAQPQTELRVPAPAVLATIIDKWAQHRKSARVLLVIDVSGSMADPVDEGRTKLDLAKEAAVAALGQFKAEDEVGLRVFSNDIGPPAHPDYLDLVAIGPVAQTREPMRARIRNLVPTNGTPLYTVARESHRQLREGYDPGRINAVLLLTDGRNEDPRNNDLQGTLRALGEGTEGAATNPVRMFTVAYGSGADLRVLREMAEATDAAVYDASDPTTIDNVFTAVVSNF
ncbi:MAG: substrate-binding and VWA domain-containing protein [Actinomycetota bacterium]|nr:substrate-binding and VWA domain-containing protein [Actinomycetota bacterium]